MLEWNEYLKLFGGLVAIVDPLGTVPIFIGLTAGQERAERRRAAATAALVLAAALGVALLSGEAVLGFFGISLPAFSVAGGLLVLLMALAMLHAQVSPARQTREEALAAEGRESVAVVPLGIPLLAGPGATSTVIVYAQRADDPAHYLIIALEIALIGLLAWGCLRLADPLHRLLGRTGINVATRIMGLFIAALGVEFMSNGLKQLFPGWA